ncbi:hypothetical protein JYU34_000241 [Plutella xylostella]|uniref:Uncharacterized protein n=2 Tax=Plutella xylostella TaxID=51655 RepID=A0ABQ7R770_PLUXY|nr:hypothetical protein JYU34_000241 [Plutella xylostella]CAG9138155.1 unnamed protein product [Plutella xylostella]
MLVQETGLFALIMVTAVATKISLLRSDPQQEPDHMNTTLKDNEAIIGKFMETLLASGRYLKMVESVDRKLNHLDMNFHEHSNTILKYLNELLQFSKNSNAVGLEKSLMMMRQDLDKLKVSVARGPYNVLVKSLETISVVRNYATRKSAYQLHSAVTKLVFIVALQTKAKYSAVLEAKSIDMISVGEHIRNIKDILINYRVFPDRISKEMLQKARAVAMDLNIVA